ncbi:MAG: hypothetical protein KIS66_05605 [Fimbriimonadaceae bacterium]|nr:hypothetical protein [Fimbriimonadaceae bacterium]
MKPSFFAFLVLVLALAGCGGGGGGGGGGTTPSGTAVAGRIVNQVTLAGVAGVRVRMLDAGNVVVGTGTTDASGAFRAPTTTGAVRFNVDFTSVSAAYYRQYDYNGKSYSPLIDGCNPALPFVVNGTTTNLTGSVVLRPTTVPPPAPPTGCS